MDIFYLIILAMFFFMGYYNLNKDDVDDDDDTAPKRKGRKQRRSKSPKRKIQHSADQDSDTETLDKAPTTDLEIKVICLDRSGSMSSFGNEIKSGVDSYLKEINQNNGNVKWSTITFDDIIETPVNNQRLTNKSELKSTWIEPRGCTALRDGILASIECAESMINKNNDTLRPAKTVGIEIVIFTDGMENASEKISQHELTSMIKKYKLKGWIFTFLAANQDAVATGSRFGFDAGRSMTSSAGAGHQNFAWKRAASKKKFTKKCRSKATSKRDRHYVQ